MSTILTLRGVAFEGGGRRILNSVDLALTGGRKIVMLGPNGAGKSVLIRLCHGLLQPSAGSIDWSRSFRQALVLQRPVMLRRSAHANVMYALRLAGVARAEAARRANVALARVNLAHLDGRSARVLSGGEQQRVALARAWALEPEVLFLDEPTAALDPSAATAVESIIGAIHATGTSIVMITHHLGLARRFADEIVLVADGQIAEHAPVGSFFRAPTSQAGEDFLRSELP